MMSTNPLKRKQKTKIWIYSLASALIIVVLILGCYRKANDGGNPYFLSKAEQNIRFSEKDLKQFASSVKVIDGQAESHYKMALHFQRRKKHKLAIEELIDAIHLNPMFAKAYNAMGVSYDNLRRYDQAISCYQSALKLDPKLDYVYNNLGYSYLLKNELDAALKAFQKAIELNGNNKRYRNNLGLAYIMKDQYDNAYEQFKIVEDETEAKEKLTRLLDKLGKENPQQYLAKDSDSEAAKKKSKNKTPVVIRLKITDKEQQFLTRSDIFKHKPNVQEIKDTQFPLINKKDILKLDEDKTTPDETETSTGYSRVSSVKNTEIAGPKKVKRLETIKKGSYRGLQTESNHFDQSARCEFCEEDTIKSDNAAIDANQVQIISAENQKPLNLHKKPAAKSKAEVHEAAESKGSSERMYYISAAEQILDRVIEKNVSTESVKTKPSASEIANRVQNTVEPKVIEVEKSYVDAKKTVTETPASSKKTKTDFVKTNQKVLKKNQRSIYAAAEPTIKLTDKKIGRKVNQNTKSQQNEALTLAAKEANLKEFSKSDEANIQVEIEVANGNGVNGAAGRFGRYLRSKGFKVAKVTNANSFDHMSTKIFYSNGYNTDVYNLLHQIPIVMDRRCIIELKNLKSRFKIIIGKDLVKHDKIISKTIYRKRKS